MRTDNKLSCDGQTCMLCRLSMPEWKTAVRLQVKNYRFKKNETIFREGDPVEGIYFVYDGIVKVHKHWGTDKDLIVRFAGKGEILGHRGIGSTENLYPVTATAMSPVTVCYVDMPFFEASLKVNHEFLYQLMRFYAQELQEAERYMHGLAHLPVKARLANALLLLHTKFGTTPEGFINLPLTKQDLSAYIGATYETTFRVLQDLIAAALVRSDGKLLAITQPEALQEILRAAGASGTIA
ncbi:Crp/Fnr family transcriptional regulator [Chitinophaga sp. Cy-1792]|uniref:Crp/Fnr family transcriptional regulator n=1 Tax=Chitinophaga sp. Cy-1792 TaxID=2608339 RepID=UPI00141D996E|nr:Crp/Fnr family transcriptional regulator [Chitinophaga sp. Cy-1792]NIG55513.1 Crp/Fnr family transcriptional regulator [Chitinophaga sp. Cy-1792]